MAYSKQKMAEYINIYRHNRRIMAYEILGGVCVGCGTKQGLEFDHKDPTTKKSTIAKLWTASKETFMAEVLKCQLLCRPCHLEKSKKNGELGREISEHGRYMVYKRGCRCRPCSDVYKESSRKSNAKYKRKLKLKRAGIRK